MKKQLRKKSIKHNTNGTFIFTGTIIWLCVLVTVGVLMNNHQKETNAVETTSFRGVYMISEDTNTMHAGEEEQMVEKPIEGMQQVPIWVSSMYGTYHLWDGDKRCDLCLNGEDDIYSITIQSVVYTQEGIMEDFYFTCENGTRTESGTLIFQNFVTGVEIEISPQELSNISVTQTKGGSLFVSGVYNKIKE